MVQYVGGQNVVMRAHPVPFGSDLAVWFFDSDEGGCTGWDSNYDATSTSPSNRRRTSSTSAPTGPRTATRAAAPSFLIRLDLLRLPQCRAQCRTAIRRGESPPTPASAQHAGWGVAQGVGLNGRDAAAARFHAPAGASSAELVVREHQPHRLPRLGFELRPELPLRTMSLQRPTRPQPASHRRHQDHQRAGHEGKSTSRRTASPAGRGAAGSCSPSTNRRRSAWWWRRRAPRRRHPGVARLAQVDNHRRPAPPPSWPGADWRCRRAAASRMSPVARKAFTRPPPPLPRQSGCRGASRV